MLSASDAPFEKNCIVNPIVMPDLRRALVVSHDLGLGLAAGQDAVSALSQAEPDIRIESPGLCRALFEVYLGSNSVVPDAIGVWAEGTKKLLESEEVKRATRRGGSG